MGGEVHFAVWLDTATADGRLVNSVEHAQLTDFASKGTLPEVVNVAVQAATGILGIAGAWSTANGLSSLLPAEEEKLTACDGVSRTQVTDEVSNCLFNGTHNAGFKENGVRRNNVEIDKGLARVETTLPVGRDLGPAVADARTDAVVNLAIKRFMSYSQETRAPVLIRVARISCSLPIILFI